jgi:hypothetical protein
MAESKDVSPFEPPATRRSTACDAASVLLRHGCSAGVRDRVQPAAALRLGGKRRRARPHDPPPADRAGRATRATSSVQVRNPRALELSDHVLEQQFSPLQSPEHDLIDVRVVNEPRDHLIQVSMLDAQLFESLHVPEDLSFYLFAH